MSKDGKLYLLLSDTLYQFQMEDKSYKALQEGMKKEYFYVSENGRYAAWMEGIDPYNADAVILLDLETGKQQKVSGDSGTKIRLFGFINNDMVYGFAKKNSKKWE